MEQESNSCLPAPNLYMSPVMVKIKEYHNSAGGNMEGDFG
jgi:hypothetical protein